MCAGWVGFGGGVVGVFLGGGVVRICGICWRWCAGLVKVLWVWGSVWRWEGLVDES